MNLEEAEKESLSAGTLYQEVTNILKRYSSSLGSLSLKIGISQPTLWRWANQVNSQKPDPNKLLLLLSYDSNRKSIPEIAKFYSGHISIFLRTSFPTQFLNSQNINNEIEIIDDQYDFYIYYICGTEKGASKSELIYTLGQVAAKKAEIPKSQLTLDLVTSLGSFTASKIERLVAADIIILNEYNRYVRNNKNTYINVKEGLDRGLQLLKDFIKPESWDGQKSLFYIYQESVDPSIAKEVTKDLKQAYIHAKEKLLSNKSSSHEAIPYIISVTGESLCFENTEVIQ